MMFACCLPESQNVLDIDNAPSVAPIDHVLDHVTVQQVTAQQVVASQLVESAIVISAALTLHEEDLRLLRNVTEIVDGFDPLVQTVKPERFIPVLEAAGGTDKDAAGHRRDTLPIAREIPTAFPGARTESAVFQLLEENDGANIEAVKSNDAVLRIIKSMAHGVIVRINPGTLSNTSQLRADNILRELADSGLVIMSHPDVNRSMGAKDALVKIRHLKSGLTDTYVYYDAHSFSEGFCKSIAKQPRVIKQNRGSQGEGIWIIKLKDESLYGQMESASFDTDIILTEAYDNHVEYHTVGEFIEFCINGRSQLSGFWTSTGKGKYLNGGVAAGAMIVDQRFLPRIVEGEVRCLMVGSELIELVHKVPMEGGLSATLQSGAVYTKYAPDHPRFAKLVSNFQDDIPKIMGCFGYQDQPLPLLWTADYIMGDTDDELYIGEINCSCVGITQQLQQASTVAKVAVETVFPSDQ